MNIYYDNDLKSRLLDICIIMCMVLFLFIIVYPFVHILAVSVSSAEFTMRGEVTVLPKGLTLVSYKTMVRDIYFIRAYGNTIYYSFLGTVLALLLTTIAAYPLAQEGFSGKKLLTAMYTFTMFFNGGMIPHYLVVRSLGMLDTVWAITLPVALSVWNIIIFRTFFKNIPSSLSESAFIDGANHWVVLLKIILPLSKPIIATISLFTIVSRWNDFFGPFLYLSTPEKQPLSMVLRRILLSGDMAVMVEGGMVATEEVARTTTQTLQYAAVIVVVFPIMCIYPFIQKYFVKGVMIGSIKG